ncbi:MAG: S9 family peptidase [Gammaproteobacteria bacterium]|nr:MAG: S9 family peptidase [Gammaproteobacteria bacterium]
MPDQSRVSLRLRVCWSFLVLAAAGSSWAAVAPKLPVDAFGTLPLMGQARISPDGRYVAAAMLDGARYSLVIFDLQQIGQKPPFRAPTGDWDVNWIHWKVDNRLLVSVRQAFHRNEVGVIETRLWSLNADGSDLKRLVQPKGGSKGSWLEGSQAVVQVADAVIDFLPDDPRHILMAFNPEDPRRPRLYQVDIRTDRRAQVAPGGDTIQRWMLDSKGRVRLAQGRNYSVNNANLKTYYRATEKDDWTEIWDEGQKNAEFSPVVFDRSDPDILYVSSDHENGRHGLYRYRLSSQEFVEKLFLHPEMDIDEIILDPQGLVVEAVSYVTDTRHFEWFSADLASIYREIRSQLPGWSIKPVSRAFDDSRVIVYASAADHSSRYYIYERAAKKLQLFAPTFPQLDEHDLSRVVPVSYRARDGLEIPAYLTLPPGVRHPPQAPLPAVVMPHGGPEARDYGEFDPAVQMLANHGYAVLQMNFRGSSGYGAEFEQAGRREWGEAMQDDVTDGTRWLIDSKIADPARICIVGGSYGGYAALMGVVREPQLYRCAVSINGVTDLPDLLNHRAKFVGGRNATTRRIGEIWRDSEKLERNSPARRAADIRVPVLILHGTDDRVVPVEQSRKMRDALENASKTYRYVELQDEEHWLTHRETRLQYFQELDAFLAAQLR